MSVDHPPADDPHGLSQAVSEWESAGGSSIPRAVLRVARRLPGLPERLASSIVDPVDRMLLGLERCGPLPVISGESALDESGLENALWCAQACFDEGVPVPADWLGQLEDAISNSSLMNRHWPCVARLRARVDVQRVAEVRKSVAIGVVPWSSPGELSALQVHLLAAGDRVLGALDVDTVQRLTKSILPAIEMDLQAAGLWFWPHMRWFSTGVMQRKLRTIKPVLSGRAGMVMAYQWAVGDWSGVVLDTLEPMDRLVFAILRASRSSL